MTVRELTGDMQLTKTELEETQVACYTCLVALYMQETWGDTYSFVFFF